MCRGCFGQLLLRDEFHSGGIAGLLGNAAGMPTRRAFMAYSVGAASTLTAVGASPAFAADEGADLILRGGTIRTLPGAPVASALAVKGGRVLAGGDEGALAGLKANATRIVDLGGRTLLPGFIDPHCHTIAASLIFELLDDVGYAKYPTREKLAGHLKQEAASAPKGQWIVGANFDNLLQGGDFTRNELDEISSDHPILIWYVNLHDACVNSEAFKIAGIGEDVGELSGGGHFGRGADGKLNGMVYEESAMLKFAVHFLGKITPEVAAKAVTDFCRHTGSVGNTMLHEPGTIRSDWIEPFAKLSNTLACRTSASVMFDDMKGLTPWRSLGLGKGAPVANSLFSLYGVKIVGDGSNQTETGAQTKPYLNSTSKGSPNFDAALMKQMVADVKAFGLPVLIHCNGDFTVDIALDAIEAAYAGSTDHGVNRIEHSTMARPDQILRMKKLNVQPSFLMNHVRFYGAAYRDQIFGPERAAFMTPRGPV
jgi:predicted amidohydrolase YtcJ